LASFSDLNYPEENGQELVLCFSKAQVCTFRLHNTIMFLIIAKEIIILTRVLLLLDSTGD
jgi:hypothetical protein